MAAHHVKHAMSCPANGNGRLVDCECGAPGAAKAKEAAARRASVVQIDPAELAAALTEMEAVAEQMATDREVALTSMNTPMDTAAANLTQAQARAVMAPLSPAAQQGLMGVWRQIMSPGGLADVVLAEEDPSTVDKAMLDRVGELVSSMSGRPISLERRDGTGPVRLLSIAVLQRCPTCREEYRTPDLAQPESADEVALTALVGLAARKARLQHRCLPFTSMATVLAQMSHGELELLAQDIERDGIMMVERAQMIADFANAKAKETPQ